MRQSHQALAALMPLVSCNQGLPLHLHLSVVVINLVEALPAKVLNNGVQLIVPKTKDTLFYEHVATSYSLY